MDALAFIKMHGLGNDFVVIDGRAHDPQLTAGQVARIADRHTGIGCDQLIVLETPPSASNGVAADVFMRIYNQDGSSSDACGNATRCISSLIMTETGSAAVNIQTGAGVLATGAADGGRVSVDMGPVNTDWQSIPLAEEANTAELPIDIAGLARPIAVNVGNPHMIFFVDDAEAAPIDAHGQALEHHPLFPERTNVQMAEVLADGSIRLKTWERGVGRTSASGSSACAVLAAAHLRGLTGREADVVMDGGVLHIEWRADNHVVQTGPVATSFRGIIDPTLLG
ncbi:MAG: diaminopimelate epimerase [Rhodospirillales bacterium]